jgi:hypothetical protein
LPANGESPRVSPLQIFEVKIEQMSFLKEGVFADKLQCTFGVTTFISAASKAFLTLRPLSSRFFLATASARILSAHVGQILLPEGSPQILETRLRRLGMNLNLTRDTRQYRPAVPTSKTSLARNAQDGALPEPPHPL